MENLSKDSRTGCDLEWANSVTGKPKAELLRSNHIFSKKIDIVLKICITFSREEMESVSSAKKQAVSGSAATSQPIQESVNRSPILISDSKQGRALNHHSKDPAMATATA